MYRCVKLYVIKVIDQRIINLSSFRLVCTVTGKPDWSPQFADIIISKLIIPYPSNHFFIPVEIGLSILPHPDLVLFSLRSGPPFYLTVLGWVGGRITLKEVRSAQRPHQSTVDCASCLSNGRSISQMSHTGSALLPSRFP